MTSGQKGEGTKKDPKFGDKQYILRTEMFCGRHIWRPLLCVALSMNPCDETNTTLPPGCVEQAAGKRTSEPLFYTDVCLLQSVNQLYNNNNNKMAKLVLFSTAWC